MFIHISGASGSGKTTLLAKLTVWCKEHKITAGFTDADDIVAHIMSQIDTMPDATDAAKGKAFEHLLTTRLRTLVESKPIYIIAGLLDTVFGGVVYYARMNPDHKFYIKIKDSVLLKQYLHRIVSLLADQNYQTQLLTGAASIVFDRDSLLKWAYDTHDVYCGTLHYDWLSSDQILKKCTTAIKAYRR
jgi:adenylate kinase family enzyme